MSIITMSEARTAVTGEISNRRSTPSVGPQSTNSATPPQTVELAEIENGRECLLCEGRLMTVVSAVIDTRFGIGGSYDIFKCASCGLEQTHPIPSLDDLKSLYETHYNFGGERDTTYTRIREWFHFSPLYRAWMILDGDFSFHRPKGYGRLLDIGCNEGRGLRIYKANGFQAEGLELNENAARAARKNGFTVHSCLLKDFQPSELYDVAVLSNVLEHSLNPGEMLADVRRILKAHGQIWISCPNSRSWQRTVFGRDWANWHVPFHIVHFSSDTLKGVLLKSRFANVKITQVTPALWVASNFVVRAFARSNRVTKELRNPFLMMFLMLAIRGLLFPFLWLGNRFGLGDCLVVVANKA